MAMGGGVPSVGQLKSEISASQKQERQASAGKTEAKKAIDGLKSAISEISSRMGKIRTQLSQEMPPDARKQLTDALSQLKHQQDKLRIQLSKAREQLGMAGKAETASGKRVRMLKNALSKMVGQMSMRPMNREAKGTKG